MEFSFNYTDSLASIHPQPPYRDCSSASAKRLASTIRHHRCQALHCDRRPWALVACDRCKLLKQLGGWSG